MINAGVYDIRSTRRRKHIPLLKQHFTEGFIHTIEWVSGNIVKITLFGMADVTDAEWTIVQGKPIKCYVHNCTNTENIGVFFIHKITNKSIYITNPAITDNTHDETFATEPTDGDDQTTIEGLCGLISIDARGLFIHGAYFPINTAQKPASVKKNLEGEDIEYVYSTPGNFYFELGRIPQWFQINPIVGTAEVSIYYSVDGIHYAPYGAYTLQSSSGSPMQDTTILINVTSGPLMLVANQDVFSPGMMVKVRVANLTNCQYSVNVLP